MAARSYERGLWKWYFSKSFFYPWVTDVFSLLLYLGQSENLYISWESFKKVKEEALCKKTSLFYSGNSGGFHRFLETFVIFPHWLMKYSTTQESIANISACVFPALREGE